MTKINFGEMPKLEHNSSYISTNFKKFLRFSRGAVMVVVSALFLLGAASDRSIELRQLAAKLYLTSMTKGQQAYYAENGSFADRIDELGLGIPTETEYYSYRIQINEEERVVIIAIPKSRDLKSYAGAAFVATGDYYTTQAIICESDRPSQVPPSTAWVEGRLICSLNSSPPSPSIPNLSIKERQFEAQVYISSLNKGQQAYYIEFGNFADKIDELGLGIRTETESYRYQIKTFEDKWVVTTATPKFNDLKSYTGVVFLTLSQEYLTMKSIVCESDRPSSIPPLIEWVEEEVKCAFGSSPL